MASTVVEKKFYSLAEIAEILGFDPKTVRRRISEGSIRAIRIGGSIRIPVSEVERISNANPIGNA